MRAISGFAAVLAFTAASLSMPATAQYGGYPGNGYPGNGYGGGIVRCQSWNYAYAQCGADTRGGVRLARVVAGDCRPRNWGSRPGAIWVNNGCRADFQVGRGGGGYPGGGYPNPGYDGDRGPSAGAVIGGVAVAAGLLALLAKSNADTAKAAAPVADGGRPARITVDSGGVEPAARSSLDQCLREAAREIGVTGGSEIRLDRFDSVERGNGGWRFRFTLDAVYPDATRRIPMYCRATPTRLVELTFADDDAR